MGKEKITRSLSGLEEIVARQSLDFMSEFGIKSIQMGGRKIEKKGKKIIETQTVKKTNKK